MRLPRRAVVVRIVRLGRRFGRRVGPGWARWIAMAGETIGAHQALEIGLVQAVYPAAEFDERVQAFARRLAAMPPEALGL